MNVQKIISLFLVLVLGVNAHAQEFYCASDGKVIVPLPLKEETSENKMLGDIISNILVEMLGKKGIEAGNFQLIPASNISGAQAEYRGKDAKRIIWYNPIIVSNLYQDNEWKIFKTCMVALFGHEIGHLIRDHTLSYYNVQIPSVSREESADNEAGWWVRRMGLSIEDAMVLYNRFPQRGSDTHPPKDVRIRRLKQGYEGFPERTESLTGSNYDYTISESYLEAQLRLALLREKIGI